MNITTSLADIAITRSLVLERVKNGLNAKVASMYQGILKDIEKRMRNNPEMNIKNMNKIIREIKSTVTTVDIKSDLTDLANQEASYAISSTNAIAGGAVFNKVVKESTIKNIVNTSLMEGATISNWFSSLNKSTQTDLERQIKQGVVIGETNQEIAKRIKNTMNINRNHAEAITRTAVATVSNQARQAVYDANDDVMKGYEHVSTLDSKTTFICSSRDGAAWSLDGEGINALGKQNKYQVPPLHFGCRSVLVPVLKSWEDLDIDIKEELPKGTRSSMDGYVSSGTTFNTFLKGKNTKWQEKYLGKGRYELWKSGKITLSDLVTQQGKTLSLDELREL